jgi:phosphatidylinositol alpha-mannosyltransferase
VNTQLSCAKRRRVAPRVRLVVVSLVVGGGVGLAALALTRLNLSRSLQALTNVRPGFAALTFALLSASLMARAECWYVILRGARVSTRISRLVSARATMIGVMVSATLPGRLGEPARVFVVARRTGDSRHCIALVAGTVLAQTLLNMAALLALASVLLASFTLSRDAAWAIGLATAVPIVGVAVILTGPRLLNRAATKTTPLGRAAAFARTETERIRGGLRVFRRPRDAFHATTAQLVAWSLQLLACDALLSAFGIATPSRLGTAAAVLVATNVAAVVPVTPGNVGVFQAACVAVLAAYGVGAGRALAYGIALQLLEVTTAIALGLPALLAEGLRPHDLRLATQRAVIPPDPLRPPSKPRPGTPPADRAAADPGS